MASGWRGYVRALKKSGAFQDSAHNGLQTSAGIHMAKYSHVHINTFIYMNYENCKMYLQALLEDV
jgi:hypothetical protein